MGLFGGLRDAIIVDERFEEPALAAAYLAKVSTKEENKRMLMRVSQCFESENPDIDLSPAATLEIEPGLTADALISTAFAVYCYCVDHLEGPVDDLKKQFISLEAAFKDLHGDPAWHQPEVVEELRKRKAYHD